MFFFENRQQFNVRAGQKETRPKSNARAHLKRRKKHSGLTCLLYWRQTLKGLAQAKIIKKSVILFRVLNMTI